MQRGLFCLLKTVSTLGKTILTLEISILTLEKTVSTFVFPCRRIAGDVPASECMGRYCAHCSRPTFRFFRPVFSGYFPYFCRKLKGLKPLAFRCFSQTDLGRAGRMRAGAFPLSGADRCGCMGREDGDLRLSFLPSARLPLAGR